MAGSNADLPIVGGSILSHDHFQGGSYVFTMAKAPYEQEFDLERYPDIHAGIVKWPMSVIRLQGRAMDSIVAVSYTHLAERCTCSVSSAISSNARPPFSLSLIHIWKRSPKIHGLQDAYRL